MKEHLFTENEKLKRIVNDQAQELTKLRASGKPERTPDHYFGLVMSWQSVKRATDLVREEASKENIQLLRKMVARHDELMEQR